LTKRAIFPSEHSISKDSSSGRTVHQMTAANAISHATYFLQSSFSPGGGALLFVSYRSGSAQLYEISPFPHGPIRQLTSGPAIHPFSPAWSPGGQAIYFVRAGEIWALEYPSLAERKVFAWEGAQLGEVSLAAGGASSPEQEGTWLVAAAKHGSTCGMVTGRADGGGWHFIAFARTVIHPQFHPTDPEWIEFAGDPAPRMHRVRRNGTEMKCLYEHGNSEFVVHETFLGKTGDLVYTVWPHGLWRMDWHTGERSRICEFNAWHITPNTDGTKILCDTNHPDKGIHLIDVATGTAQFLCRSDASSGGSQWKTSRYALAEDFARARNEAKSTALSWMEVATDTVYGPQWTHPHPSFSPDESKVVFASDRSGMTQVYVVT